MVAALAWRMDPDWQEEKNKGGRPKLGAPKKLVKFYQFPLGKQPPTLA
jgi:hypothetical protein